ncbi:MAG: type II toxin-antitoxin system HipA family toxin [Thermodesulfobacteriota bacterium]|nr:type II toxin-antitoxin system HipA family toxin [Thermodesulfobacteriota bacterium]
MKNKNRLLIIWDEQLVGTLERHTKGRVFFQYSQDWLTHVERPISLSLPCREKKYSPAISTAFFENLLPENNARTILAFNRRFDKKDTFAFLENFGEDCAGALSIIHEKSKMDFAPGQYQCINTELMEALDKIMGSSGKYTLFPEMKKARLSIAGVQDKLPVYIENDQFYLPVTSGSATTHIIKPANAGFPDIPRNEAFCMELARHAGLVVPDSKLMKIGNHELFVVNRYDREKTTRHAYMKTRPTNCNHRLSKFVVADENDHVPAMPVIRIHQEDFCQAMGLPADRKYQETGGPGFLQCRELADEFLSDQGVDVRSNFANIMTFNYLIGNHDAHGKNFSIIHEPNLKFAPFYDLLSTQVYPLDNKFAMAIGQTFRLDRVKEHSFKKFARDINIRPQKLFSLMNEMFQAVTKAYAPLLAKHEKKYGQSKIYNDLFEVIRKNLEQLNRFGSALV